MRKHLQLLGILNIVWGSFGLLAALIVAFIFGGVMGIIGMASGPEADAHMAVPIVGLIGSFIFLIVLVVSVPSVISGIGLLRMASWARVFGIVVSALHLFNVPFGTALGVYGLWVLLSDETRALFAPSGNPIRI